MQVVRPTAKFAHLGRVWGRRRCSWPEVACAIAERHFPAFSHIVDSGRVMVVR
jgi:hypothetical protein